MAEGLEPLTLRERANAVRRMPALFAYEELVDDLLAALEATPSAGLDAASWNAALAVLAAAVRALPVLPPGRDGRIGAIEFSGWYRRQFLAAIDAARLANPDTGS